MANIASIRDILKLHRAQMLGVTEVAGVRKLRSVYEESRRELQAKLNRAIRAGAADTFTAQHYRIMLVQVNQALAGFGHGFKKVLNDNGELAGKLGSKHLIREAQKFEKVFTGQTPVLQTAQVGVMQRIYRDIAPSLLTRHAKSMALYGHPTVEAIHRQMARSLTQNETVDQAVDRVAGTSGVFANQRWRAERIVRTEGSYSYHAVKQRTMVELKRTDMHDLKKSMVSTFDDRTGKDSYEQNQQVREVDEPFEYHVLNGKGQKTGEIIKYQAPPNRPLDRAVMIPWRPGWPRKDIGEPGAVTPRAPSEASVEP